MLVIAGRRRTFVRDKENRRLRNGSGVARCRKVRSEKAAPSGPRALRRNLELKG
jgi:hypothetical protein